MKRQYFYLLLLAVICFVWLIPLLLPVGDLTRYAFEELRVLLLGFVIGFIQNLDRYNKRYFYLVLIAVFCVVWVSPLIYDFGSVMRLALEEMRVVVAGFVFGHMTKLFYRRRRRQ